MYTYVQVLVVALHLVPSCAAQTTMCGCSGAMARPATALPSLTPSSATMCPFAPSLATMPAGHRSSASRSQCLVRFAWVCLFVCLLLLAVLVLTNIALVAWVGGGGGVCIRR